MITQLKKIKMLSQAMVSKDTIMACPYIFDQLVSMTKAKHIWALLVNRAAFFLVHWVPNNFPRCSESDMETMITELATILLILAVITTQQNAFTQDWKNLVKKINSGWLIFFLVFFLSFYPLSRDL